MVALDNIHLHLVNPKGQSQRFELVENGEVEWLEPRPSPGSLDFS